MARFKPVSYAQTLMVPIILEKQLVPRTQNLKIGTCVNNPVTFGGQPTGSEEFLNRMVEALSITIDRSPKGRPHKMES